MSLHHLAKQVQSKGRGRDTMLVHMSPREVAGLQALAMAHGGKLTVNPSTGLPEAGFLEDVLPVVAAGALTAVTAGAAAPFVAGALNVGLTTGGLLAGAGIGALVGGGMSALQGGDFGKGALMGGLSGAIGGYGGAGGFDGLFGSTAANISPETGAAIQGSDILTQAGTAAQAAPAAAPATTAPVVTQAGQQAASLQGQAQINALNKLAEQTGTGVTSAAFGTPPTPGAEQALFQAENLANPSQLGNIYNAPTAATTTPPPSSGFDLFGMKITPGMAAAGIGGIGLLGALSGSSNYGVPQQEEYESPIKRISPDFKGYVPRQPKPYYQAQYPVYAAGGGLVALAGGGLPVERMSMTNMGKGMYPQGMIDKTNFAIPSQRPAGMEVVSDYDVNVNPTFGTPQSMASGGISNLGGYSDGGRLLKGPGDGVSDSIPAQIGERQPARLADGEFVVPARIVSELGNGSTDAGARKLYGMMDRIQKVRRKSMGKGKHAVDSKPEKLLPV